MFSVVESLPVSRNPSHVHSFTDSLGGGRRAGVLGVTGLARSSKGESFLDVLQTALLPDASAAQTPSQASDADIVNLDAADPDTDQSDLEQDVVDLSRRILQRFMPQESI